jgi:hypothetical protein
VPEVKPSVQWLFWRLLARPGDLGDFCALQRQEPAQGSVQKSSTARGWRSGFHGSRGGLRAQFAQAIEVNFRDSPFELILQNQDLDALNKTSQAIANKIRAMTKGDQPVLRNVRVGFEVDKPELRVSIERSRAAALGVTVEIFGYQDQRQGMLRDGAARATRLTAGPRRILSAAARSHSD